MPSASGPTAMTMPLLHCVSALAGTISPVRVSASSSVVSTTRKSSRGSSESLIGRGSSSMHLTILPEMASPFIELDVGGRTVKVTNPDKVYFPARGETKLDLVQYFISVGDGIVRALLERPCQLKRQPEGVGGEVIWQKRVPEKRPDWIETGR